MSARTNPFEEVERLFERMSERFEDASRAWEGGDSFGVGALMGEEAPIDVVEGDGEFLVTADLPGFERSDVEIRVHDATLTIRADHEERADEEEIRDHARFVRRERRHQSVHRTVRLPAPVDADAASARMKHGVLTITLPMLEVEDEHTITVE